MTNTTNRIILLVEDNPNDEELTLIAFKRSGIANPLVIARDGVQALDYIFGTGSYQGRDLHDMPQVVILDLKLPKVDGLEVLNRIRNNEQTAHLPVVILTSSKLEEDLLEAYRLKTNAFIRKPINFEQFMEAVKQLGLFWVILNQPPDSTSPS